jgi:hypothetical protein
VSVKMVAGRVTACVGVTAWMMIVFGGEVAHADPLVGKTYSDAAATVSGWGSKAIISTVVGDALKTDECIVTSSRKASFAKGDNFEHTSGYLLALNCNAKLAGPGSPGNSAASSEGRAHKELLGKAQWINSEDGSKWCAENVDDCGNFCDSSGLCTEQTKSIAG